MPSEPTEIPEKIGLLSHLFRYARQAAAWHSRALVSILILGILAQYAVKFWYGSDHTPQTIDYLIDKAVIIAGFFVLLIGSIGRELYIIRKEKYANIFDRIEAVTSTLRDLTSYLDDIDTNNVELIEQAKRSVRSELSSALDNIGEMFSMITGTTCRVAIKCLYPDETRGNIFVYAIARDRRSNKLNAKLDADRFAKRSDSLGDNDDFLAIFTEDKRSYIENDLSVRRNYHNSSFGIFGEPPEKLGIISRILNSGATWPLPYKSTMVFAIEQKTAENLAFDEVGCIGFLAIDSAFANVFRPRFDGPLGMALANAFFSPLIRYVPLLQGEDENGVASGA